MKSPYAYIEFDCYRCLVCDACIPVCPCKLILWDWDFTCVMTDKDACMACYCDAPCRDECPVGAITLKYEKPTE